MSSLDYLFGGLISTIFVVVGFVWGFYWGKNHG